MPCLHLPLRTATRHGCAWVQQAPNSTDQPVNTCARPDGNALRRRGATWRRGNGLEPGSQSAQPLFVRLGRTGCVEQGGEPAIGIENRRLDWCEEDGLGKGGSGGRAKVEPRRRHAMPEALKRRPLGFGSPQPNPSRCPLPPPPATLRAAPTPPRAPRGPPRQRGRGPWGTLEQGPAAAPASTAAGGRRSSGRRRWPRCAPLRLPPLRSTRRAPRLTEGRRPGRWVRALLGRR
eukprot:scaffold2639_cov95-Isochrysis_galbana.AAC.6